MSQVKVRHPLIQLMSSVVGHNDHLIVLVDDLSVSMRIFAIFVLKLTKMLGHLDFHRLASRISMVVYYHTTS